MMAKNAKWNDDYWLLLMQMYLRKPVGIKPLYCRDMVTLALELHISPQVLASRMKQIDALETPRIERIWQTYGHNPRKLARMARLLREMKGFGNADEFYEGVEVNETWEKDWMPVDEHPRLTPVMLTLILDLYFRLTPQTMVVATPEVQELARQMKVPTDDVVQALEAFQQCDPYLNCNGGDGNPLVTPCQAVWQQYGNGEPEVLAALAGDLQHFF
jgi:hypothetical protein